MMIDSSGENPNRVQELSQMVDSLREGRLEVMSDGKQIEMGRKLGGGGSKNVYDANLISESFALALPNTVDNVEKMQQKWQKVLAEPESTRKIRELGLLTTPLCEAIPLTVNGIPFSGLKMTRYEDLPFVIMDSKNPLSSTGTISLPEHLNDENFQQLFSTVVSDIEILIRNGVQLGRDSFNICIHDGQSRLFLNDLGSAQFSPFSPEDLPDVCSQYVSNALLAFINGLSEEQYRRNKAFFDGELFSFDNPESLDKKIANSLYNTLRAPIN